jgi:hypothetical protein
LRFSAEEVSNFPAADASVQALKQQALAFSVCKSLLADEMSAAREDARKAMPHFVASAYDREP